MRQPASDTVLEPFKLYEVGKDWLSTGVHLTHEELHLVLGVALMLLFTRLMRLPLGSWKPLAVVAVLEGINEAFDFGRYYLSDWPWRPMPTLIDIAITLVPPAAIILVAQRAEGQAGKLE